jgi:hypothetical protein
MPLRAALGFHFERAMTALHVLLKLVHVIGACVLLGIAFFM